MKIIYPLTPAERLLSTMLNTGVKLAPGEEPLLKRTLDKILTMLTSQEEQVLRSRFGLGNRSHGQTLSEIGRALHLTRERIRQIEDQALAKIRLTCRMALLTRAFDLSRIEPGRTKLTGKARAAWGPPLRRANRKDAQRPDDRGGHISQGPEQRQAQTS